MMASVVGAADLSLFLGQCRCDLNLLDRDPRFCYFASVPDRIDIPGFCRQDVHAALCRRSAIPAAAVRLLHACSGYLGAPCASSRSSFQPSAPWTDGGMRLRHLLHWIFVADLWKASRQASLRFQAPSLFRNTFMYLSNLAEPGLPTGLPPAGFPPGFALGPERGACRKPEYCPVWRRPLRGPPSPGLDRDDISFSLSRLWELAAKVSPWILRSS